MQFDADTVGASSPAADAEICMMAADTLEALGIPRGQYVIKVNSRKVLDGVMEAIGVSDEKQKLTVLRAIDKLDRLGDSGVADLLGQGRKDESGDFTKGAGLGPEAVNRVLNFTGWRERGSSSIGGSNTVTLANFAEAVVGSELGSAGVADLNSLGGLIDATGYSDRVRIDPSVVRGLEYYTGAVFEAELTFEVTDDEGRPVRFGSVGGGGRYDGLIGRFRGEDTPATGFSIGVSRLRAALAALKQGKASEDVGPVVVTVMEKNRIGDYQRMVSRLREAGIAAELYLGDAGFRAQMKYADRRNAPVAVIQGGDEKAKGVVQIKDLAAGKAASQAISDNTAWREERPGQFEVSEDDLVAAIRKIVEARR
jgi:histidyl-tRNA synthetase